MSDLIKRQDVIDFLKLIRDSGCKKSMSAECKHKSVTRSKHDEHVAFCDYLIEYVKQVPTHTTPSKALGALDCVDRQEAIKALCREECGMDSKGCYVGTCYDVEIIEDVPSVQLELSNNSPELDNKNGELISRQAAIDEIDEWIKAFRENGHKESAADACLIQDGIIQLPSAQPEQELLKDGTLVVKTDFDMTKFDRVNVIQNGTHYGDLFYQDDDTRRKGKWIRTRTMTHDGELYCDQCGQEHPEQKIIWNFCPNCGCRMEEGDSE